MKTNKKAQGKSHFSALVILLCFIGGYLPSRVFSFYNLLFFVLPLYLIFNVSVESREGEIKEIADAIEDLKRRIQIITENSMKNAEYADRIAEIERIITERASHQNEYDDSIVRQMVECIKVYADKHIEVIFGGGYTVEETVE